MNEFFTNYPFAKWVLIGFGVIAILARYMKFGFFNKQNNRNGYKFEEVNHLENEQLKNLLVLFNEQKWNKIDEHFVHFNSSYRSFGFRTFGQYADDNKLNEWLVKEPNNDLPKIIKAYRLAFQGWEYRGRHSIDTVSSQNLALFKSCLRDAREILISIKHDSRFKVNANALLLKLYKALDTDRKTIHQTYQDVLSGNENHAELNFNYFSAISLKWGGSQEEVDTYLQSLENKSEFIHNLIIAQYYFDYVHMMEGEDDQLRIKSFIEQMKTFSIANDELYKYEFYLLLYWLSNNLEYTKLENYYKQLIQPFWKD